MDILSPAGSLSSVKSAVLNGADAIYMGYGDFNARRNAKNFTEEEFIEAISLCNSYGVDVLVTLNIVLSDRELALAVDFIKFLAKQDITAVIVQDLGVLNLVKSIAPSLRVHASTQLTVHNLEGVNQARKLGFSRVVLSRELSFENIKYICQNSDTEIEVFVHGALCMCYSGQCYLSAMIGERSGNRGLCAQPCRLPYSVDNKEKTPLLSLKDLSLINYVNDLKEAGVSCLKIEGRMKRPEYTAIVTKIYSTILKENRLPTDDELYTLEQIFSRTGFTDGYFSGKVDDTMFGTKTEPNTKELQKLHEKIASDTDVSAKNYQLIMNFNAYKNSPMELFVSDIDTNISVSVSGDVPQIATNKATSKEQILTNLSKTGGTNFIASDISINLDDGLFIPASSINKLRRDALEELSSLKFAKKNYEIFDYEFEPKIKNRKQSVKFSVEITKLSQICDTMYEKKPEILYIPLLEIVNNPKEIKKLLNKEFNLCVKLPRIILDDENSKIIEMLEVAKSLGIKNLLISNLGQIRDDFTIYGDFSLNIYNSVALKQVADLGFARQTLSFELKTSQIRDISKCIPTEILGYGYLPLMVFENPIAKYKDNTDIVYLADRKDEKFALMPEFSKRNTLLNSKPLYILDKLSDFTKIGVDVLRLYFSTEDNSMCEKIYNAHINKTTLDLDFTRGLYYRGVL